MRSRLALLLGAGLVAFASAAQAQSLAPTFDSGQPAARPSTDGGFLSRLLGPGQAPQVVAPVAPKAAAAPMELRPPAVRNAAPPKQKASRPRAVAAQRRAVPVNVPLPRLRPRAVNEDMIAAMEAIEMAVKPSPPPELLPGAAVSMETTGAVASQDALPSPMPAPAAPPNPPIQVAASTPAAPVHPKPQAAPADHGPAVAAKADTAHPEHDDGMPGDPHVMGEPAEGEVHVEAAHGEIRVVGNAHAVTPEDAQPYELIRTLQLMQDRIARGSLEDFSAQRVLREHIDKAFANADPGVWQVPKNASAAVIYVLSGGPPDTLRKLMRLDLKPSVDPNLVAGVLAYLEGREEDAAHLLESFDPMDMPPNMGAQLALAKAALAAREHPEESLKYLATARLLAPGTLVEEAAIRRQIFVADRLGDGATVEFLARRYLHHFRHSVYAGNFRDRFSAALTRMGIDRGRGGFDRIDNMLAPMEPAGRGQLYLTVSLAATVKGNAETGVFAAGRALDLAPPGSVEESRARLYRSASLLVEPEAFDEAVSEFEAARREILAPSDQSVHDSVGSLLESIRSATRIGGSEGKFNVASGGPLGSPIEETPLTTRARALLEETSDLTENAR